MRSRASEWEYRGRWALVTGASAGIGAVMAERLAARGMTLVLTARRIERLEEMKIRLRRDCGVEIVPVAQDLLQEGAAVRLWKGATDGRRIDLLVNNAGFGTRGLFHEVPLERHLDILRVNSTVLMELTHLALRDMRADGGGGIINVSSIAAFQPVPHLATYAASKAFVLSLTQAIWAENRDVGIRVVALCPGRTPTEFQAVAGTGSAEGAFGFRTPEQVVDAALRALERDRIVEIPGFENRAASWAVRALPGSALIRIMRTVVRRFWKEPAR
ncbi:MAG TPA: SDR family oxidoreductase [Longimicrobiaceae bacterium]|nr:SDR family oxidoreductase [Longimicrobiaceae bacterium]